MALTDRQREILDFITAYGAENGFAPTVREVAAAFGYRSPKAAHDHMRALERKGAVRRTRGIARGLELRDRQPAGVPVLGVAPAGRPLLAEEVPGDMLPSPLGFGNGGKLFAVKVVGDSMEPLLSSGDHAVIRAEQTAQPGEMVAARVEGEVTLKRLARRKNRLVLKPENPSYPVIPVTRDTRIIGKVVGMYRRFE